MIPAIVLDYISYKEPTVCKQVSISMSGNLRCEASNLTFNEILAHHTKNSLPKIIVKVKDIVGKTHYLDGTIAESLHAFRHRGFVKINSSDVACSDMQFFRFSFSYGLVHHFSLESHNEFYLIHAKRLLHGDVTCPKDFAKAKKYLEKLYTIDPHNEEVLILFGQLYLNGWGVLPDIDLAKSYFLQAQNSNPDNKYIEMILDELSYGDEIDEVVAAFDQILLRETEDELLLQELEEEITSTAPEKPKRTCDGCMLL